MKAWTAAVVLFLSTGHAIAQQVIEPEACILDTLKGGAPKDAASMIRYNCIRQYIRAAQAKAVGLGTDQFKGSTLAHYAEIPAIPSPIAEKLVVSLKNDSAMRVIMADISLVNKKSKVTHQFRAIADTPVEPATIDTMTAQINIGIKDMSEWTWNFVNVWGVPLK